MTPKQRKNNGYSLANPYTRKEPPSLPALYFLHEDDWGPLSLKSVTYAIALNPMNDQ